MKTIKIERFENTKYKAGDYPDKPIGKIIDEPTTILAPNGKAVAYYMEMPKNIYKVAKKVALSTKPVKSGRTSGIPQLSTVYGFIPRNPIRDDYCHITNQSKKEKDNFCLSLELNLMVAEFYKKLDMPMYYNAMEHVSAQILEDYRLVKTPWTNCNVNMNQVIKYHKDSGNIKSDFSNVIIIKDGVKGGYLACPEIGLTFAQEDGFMVFFDGQSILHGVTPCTFMNKDSYRCSIVLYTLENLRLCYPYEQELGRVQYVKSKQAKNRFATNEKLKKILGKKKAALGGQARKGHK